MPRSDKNNNNNNNSNRLFMVAYLVGVGPFIKAYRCTRSITSFLPKNCTQHTRDTNMTFNGHGTKADDIETGGEKTSRCRGRKHVRLMPRALSKPRIKYSHTTSSRLLCTGQVRQVQSSRVCVCACVRACVRACVPACVPACVV